MTTKHEAELLHLDGLGLAELRALWAEHLGTPPIIASTEVTRRWLAWELQAAKLGGFDANTRRRLRQLAKSADPKPSTAASQGTPILKPGTVLIRDWGDATHRVAVLEDGFSWAGRTWKSLSEIASAITGTHWSGPRFFGLTKRARA
jgi:hypothetical protein